MTPTFPQSETNSCKVYTGNITQLSALVAPIGHVFVNTLQASAWTRTGTGQYQSLTGTTWEDDLVYQGPIGSRSSVATGAIPLISGATLAGYYTIWAEEVNTKVVLKILVTDGAAVADLFTLIGTTTISLPEIRIYKKYLS